MHKEAEENPQPQKKKKKKRNNVICSNMDGPRDYDIK